MTGFGDDVAAMDADILASFGEDVRYSPKDGLSKDIPAIFDEAYARVELLGEMAVQSTGPAVVVRSADVPEPSTEGDTITRASRTYYVCGIEPGNGLVVLRLSEDATV